jgi:hypothetical protein
MGRAVFVAFNFMDIPSFSELPFVQNLIRKHDFGAGRYITLMVSKFPKGVRGTLFGTELNPQIYLACQDMGGRVSTCRREVPATLPTPSCNDACTRTWQPFPLKETAKVQSSI